MARFACMTADFASDKWLPIAEINDREGAYR
jgi:hypothetical protein